MTQKALKSKFHFDVIEIHFEITYSFPSRVDLIKVYLF